VVEAVPVVQEVEEEIPEVALVALEARATMAEGRG
jgi:hypothetical protein